MENEQFNDKNNQVPLFSPKNKKTQQRLHRITPKTLSQIDQQQQNNSSHLGENQQNLSHNNNGSSSNINGKPLSVKLIKNTKLQPLINNNNQINTMRPKLIQAKQQDSTSLNNSFSSNKEIDLQHQHQHQQILKGNLPKLPKKDFLNNPQIKHKILTSENRDFLKVSHQGLSRNGSISDLKSNNHNLLQFEQKRAMPVVTTTDLLNNKKKLNIEFILEKSQQQDIGAIQVLNLKQQGLVVFELDYTLQNLQVLNLSNNSIINIYGLTKFSSLKNLNLNNNFVSDLYPLTQLEKLQKLEISNNKVSDLKQLKQCKTIQYLDLSKNNLDNFGESMKYLAEITSLQELHLNENPCTQNRYSYKYDILWNLKLVKLDGEVMKERDYQLAKDFNGNKQNNYGNGGQINGQDVLNNQSELIRPSTAQSRVNKNKFNNNDDSGSLRVQELTKKIKAQEEQNEQIQQQLNIVLQEKEELIEENEKCYQEIDELYEQIQQLESQNENLQFECTFADNLKKENLDLRRKISAYESTMIFKDADREELAQQIYHFNKQEEDYKYELKIAKEKEQKLQDTIQELQEQLNMFQNY